METQRITPHERAEAIARARAALTVLTADPTTSRTTLGTGRDQLNITRNHRDRSPVLAAVETIEKTARKANR